MFVLIFRTLNTSSSGFNVCSMFTVVVAVYLSPTSSYYLYYYLHVICMLIPHLYYEFTDNVIEVGDLCSVGCIFMFILHIFLFGVFSPFSFTSSESVTISILRCSQHATTSILLWSDMDRICMEFSQLFLNVASYYSACFATCLTTRWWQEFFWMLGRLIQLLLHLNLAMRWTVDRSASSM